MNTLVACSPLFLVLLGCFFPLGSSQKWNRQVCPRVIAYKSLEECPTGTNNLCTSNDDCLRAGVPSRCCPTDCGVSCQPPQIASGCPIPVDLGLVLDSSGSIGKRNWKKVLNFAKGVADAYDVSEDGTHIGLITYHDDATLNIPFDRFSGAEVNAVNLKREIDNIPLGGGLTYMDKALNLANDVLFQEANGMRKDRKKIVIFMTDGIQTKVNYTEPDIVAQKLKQRGIDIYAVGVGADVEVIQLIDISNGDGYIFQAKNFDDLQAKVQDILQKQCTGCDEPLDLVFGLPNSRSLGNEMQSIKQSASKLASLFKVKNDVAHIGVVAYNEEAHLDLPIDQAYSVPDVQTAINGMKQSSQHGFNTAAAMTVAADHAFTIYGGVRQTQPKVMVLFVPRGSTSSGREIAAAAEKLKKNGIRLMVVGLKGSADKGTWSSLVTQPSSRFLIDTISYEDMNAATFEIADTVCRSKYGKCPVPRLASSGGTSCEVDKDCPEEGQICCSSGGGDPTCTIGHKNCFVPFEMAIAMDISETVNRADFVRMKEFVQELMWPYANSENANHFGLMTFAGTSKTITKGFRKFRNEQEIKSILDSVEKTQDPQRRVDTVFETAAKEFFSMEGGTRHGHARYLVVLASDETSPESGDLQDAAKQLDFMNVKRVAVATNGEVPPLFLQSLASQNNLVFQAKEASELGQVAKNIQASLCKPKPGFCPDVEVIFDRCSFKDERFIACGETANKFGQSQKENDWDCPGEQKCCKDAGGCFYCTDPPLVCDKPRDLLVMIENTDAIGGKRAFGEIKEIVSRFVGAFEVSGSKTHVGIGTYRGDGRSVIRFNDPEATNKAAAQARIGKIPFGGGGIGSTTAALESAANNFFEERDGMRPLANKSLVIIGAGGVRDRVKAAELASELRSRLVDVFDVTIGDDADYGALRKIVSREVDNNVFVASSAEALTVQLRELVRTVCDGALKDLINPTLPSEA